MREGAFYRSLRAAAEAPRVRAAFAACAPLSAADHRPVPYLRYWLHGDPGTVDTVEKHKAPTGRVLVLPRLAAETRFYQKNFPHVRATRRATCRSTPTGLARARARRPALARKPPACS